MTRPSDDGARAIAEILLAVGAVSINVAEPFTYASGVRSPIYCDNRLLMSYPVERRAITRGLAGAIAGEADLGAVEVVAGVATSGIPFAAWLAAELDLPMVYVRDAPKAHGLGRQVEGVLRPGQRTVVVEDLVTTGKSALQTVEGLRAAGAEVVCSTAIFTYENPSAVDAFGKAGVRLLALSGISTLLEVATATGRISQADAGEVRRWLGTLATR